MYSKTLLASVALLTAASSVSAHALIAPPLGVAGNPSRGDVGRPGAGNECGKGKVAGSKAVNADASGSFSVTGQSFNGGTDGSTQVTMTVDVTGKGNGAKFASIGSVTKNGNAKPNGAENGVAITATLGAGTKCTGPGNTCVVAFKTAGGFGNCVLVKQGGGAAAGGAAPAAAAAAGGAAPAAAPAAPPAAAPPPPAAAGGAGNQAAAGAKKTGKKAGAKKTGAKKGGAKKAGAKKAGAKKPKMAAAPKAAAAAPKAAAPKAAAAAPKPAAAVVPGDVNARFAAARKGAGARRELDSRAVLSRAPRMVRARMNELDLD